MIYGRDKIHPGVLAGTLWAVSFFLSFGLLAPQEIGRLAAVLSGFAGLGVLVLAGGGLDTRAVCASAIAKMMVMFWLLAALSCAWSVAPYLSLIHLGTFSLLPATVLAVLFARDNVRRVFMEAAAWAGGAVVAGAALWAVLQVFVFPEYLVNGQVRHPFANPNAFAALLGLSFFAVLGLFVESGNHTRRKVYGLFLILTLAGLAAIASRAGSVAFVLGLIVFAALSWRSVRPQLLPLAVILMIGGVIAFIMALIPDKTDVITQLAKLAEGKARSGQVRMDLWHSTWALIGQNPFLGSGYRTFNLMYPGVRALTETNSGGFMAHSDPLQFWAEMGIFAPVLFYAIGVAVLVRVWRSARGPLVTALLCGCGAFVLHSHVDFLFYTMPTLMAFGLALAVLVDRTESTKVVTPLSFARGWSPPMQAAVLVVPVAGFLLILWPLTMGEYFTNRAAKMIAANDVEGFAESVNTANRAGMKLNARPFVMAATVPIGVLKARFPAIPPEEQKALFQQAEGLLAAAEARNSMEANVQFHRGELAQFVLPSVLPPDYPLAEQSFIRALEINPLHLPSRLALARIYEAQQDQRRALDTLMAGIDWPYQAHDATELYRKAEELARVLGDTAAAERTGKAEHIQTSRVERAARQKSAIHAP